MKDFVARGSLRWATLFSLAAHLFLVGWASSLTRVDPADALDDLRLVPVNSTRLSPSDEEPPLFDFPSAPRMPALQPRLKDGPRAPRMPRAPVRRLASAKTGAKSPTAHAASAARSAAHSSARSAARPGATGHAAGKTPLSAARSGTATGDGDEEIVPDGPVDLTAKGGEDDAVKATSLTQGALVKANAKIKGEVNAGLVRSTSFSGPGPLFIASFDVPASAPPGSTYRLELTDAVLSDKDGGAIPFQTVSGQLLLLPSKAKLPPDEKPVLKGAMIGVGRIRAHRGTTIQVEVWAGDGIKDVMGVQAKLKIKPDKIPIRKKPAGFAPAFSSPPGDGTNDPASPG